MGSLLKTAAAACLIGLAVGMRGPDGSAYPWRDVAWIVGGGSVAVVIVLFWALLVRVHRDAQADIEVSADQDAGAYTPRGVPPHDPPDEIERSTEDMGPTDDLHAMYLAGLNRGRSLVERAHRLRPAHEVCGTAE